MDEVSFSGLVIILALRSLVTQYLRCNSCKVSLMKTPTYIGIFWKVLMLHPSIFGCICVSQPSSIHLLSCDFCPLAREPGCKAPGCWRCCLQLLLSPGSEGTFSQTGAGRCMSQQLRGLSSLPCPPCLVSLQGLRLCPSLFLDLWQCTWPVCWVLAFGFVLSSVFAVV